MDLNLLTVTAQQRLDAANETYRNAKDTGTVLSLLLLALAVRRAYPTCTSVRLERSDQGDFMTLDGAEFLDKQGRDVATDDAQRIEIVEQADCSFAWNLEPRDAVWTRYCSDAAGTTFDVGWVIDRLRTEV